MQGRIEPDPAVVAGKRALRDAAAAARDTAHRADGGAAAGGLAETGLDLLGGMPAGCVAGFIPYRSEIDTRPLLHRLAGQGWTVALPVVIGPGQPLEFRQWQPGGELVPGRWDIPVPPHGATVVAPDVLLVPMLAFDRNGYRLGYGGGFYDRSLARLRAAKPTIAVGVAYDAQEVAAVPHEAFDQRLDWILTPSGATAVPG